MIKRITLFFTFLAISQVSSAQKMSESAGNKSYAIENGSVTFSIGYGAPSILRSYLKLETNEDNLQVKGYGPLSFKTDFMISPRFSVGTNVYYNYSNVSWLGDGRSLANVWGKYTYGAIVKEVSYNLRANYHYYRSRRLDMYAGIAAGYGWIEADSYNEAPRPAYTAYISLPEPLSFELSTTCRYKIGRNFGLWTELGIGRSWLLFEKYFLPEALVQGGIFYNIR